MLGGLKPCEDQRPKGKHLIKNCTTGLITVAVNCVVMDWNVWSLN